MQPENFERLFSVPRETMERLGTYHALLLKWQKAINLVSPQSLGEVWLRHFADSAQLAPLVPKNIKLADLGSGAGFPGLVLALMRPDLDVHLIESDERKAQFLKTVSRETGVPVNVHQARVEDVLPGLSPDMVTARALASLAALLEFCLPCAQDNPRFTMLFLKGQKAQEELEEARAVYAFSFECLDSKTDPAGQILRIESLTKR